MEGGVGGHSGPLEALAEGVQKFQLMTPYDLSPTENYVKNSGTSEIPKNSRTHFLNP